MVGAAIAGLAITLPCMQMVVADMHSVASLKCQHGMCIAMGMRLTHLHLQPPSRDLIWHACYMQKGTSAAAP